MELIVAASENDVIGSGNRLPWHLPADLKRFKALTLGRHVLMGRKTHESIGRALPDRTNLVLSRSLRVAPAGCTLVGTLDEACAAAAGAPLRVIGGAEIYRLCLPRAARIHLTLVHARVAGDTFFDAWRGPEWREASRERHAADGTHAYAFSFVTLERSGGASSTVPHEPQVRRRTSE